MKKILLFINNVKFNSTALGITTQIMCKKSSCTCRFVYGVSGSP